MFLPDICDLSLKNSGYRKAVEIAEIMLFVEKIGRNSIVLLYDRTVQQCDRRMIDGLGLRNKRLSLYLVSSTKN